MINFIILLSIAATAYLAAQALSYIYKDITARREHRRKEQDRIRALVCMKQRFIIYNNPDINPDPDPTQGDIFEIWIDKQLLKMKRR